MESVLLHGDHLNQLAASGHESTQILLVFVWKEPGLRAQNLSKLSQNICIESIGFGESSCGLGKVSDLAGVDENYRQLGFSQSCNHIGFVASGSLNEDLFGRKSEEALGKGLDACFVVVLPEVLPFRPYTDVELIFGYVYADEARLYFHDGVTIPFLA